MKVPPYVREPKANIACFGKVSLVAVFFLNLFFHHIPQRHRSLISQHKALHGVHCPSVDDKGYDPLQTFPFLPSLSQGLKTFRFEQSSEAQMQMFNRAGPQQSCYEKNITYNESVTALFFWWVLVLWMF